MSRLIVLVQRPYHLTPEESEQWLLRQAAGFAAAPGVRRVDLCQLASVSLRFGREWDWLFEFQLEHGEGAAAAIRDPACASLLADLRVLGMKPSIAVVARTIATEGPR